MNQPKPLNNRLDFLKDERPQNPPPRKVYPYTTSNYHNQEIKPRCNVKRELPPQKRELPPQKRELQPTNDRFKYLKTETNPPPVKKGFVAMPSRKHWEEGYRPGWILRNDKSPPENYDVGYKMYLNYLKTGEVVFDDYKPVVDKAKNIGTAYLNKQNRKN